MLNIAENLANVRQQLEESIKKADRNSAEVSLLAVSKTRAADELRAAYAQGQRHFGENYLQESLEKIHALADLDICWHFIGPLQSNKTRAVAENFAWMHTVDRLKIAQRLSEQRPAHLPPLNICLQVNISREESKSGCLPEQLSELAAAVSELSGIRVRGLMAIPKASDNATEQQQAFAAMQQLFQGLQVDYPAWDTLSMGMSGDMPIAVAEGATIVRIGTAIFGPRPSKQ